MRKTTGVLTGGILTGGILTDDNANDNMRINRPLLLEPIHPKKNYRCLITGIVILTHSLTFLLGFYVNQVLRKDDCLDGSM
jgi:hypothetical protein